MSQTPSNSPQKGLSSEQAQVLSTEGLIGPLNANGKRKISSSFLTPPTSSPETSRSAGSRSSSGSHTLSAAIHHASSQVTRTDMLELPGSIGSLAYYQYLGFTEEVANLIHGRFLQKAADNPYEEVDFAVGYAQMLNSQSYRAMPNAAAALHRLGIAQELIEILLDERFKDIASTQTIHYWLVDTIKSRHNTLSRILSRTVEHAVKIKAAKGRHDKKKAKLDQAGEAPQSSSSITSVTAILEAVGEHAIIDTMGMFPQAHTTYGPKEFKNDPEWMCLYKGKGAGELVNQNQLIADDGSINIATLQTYPGGDFNATRTAYYWSDTMAVAEQYRHWAAERVPHQETWLITIRIRRQWYNNLRHQSLWYGADWKEFVWYCRAGGSKGQMPSKLDKYFKQIDVLTGHLSKTNSTVVTNIPKANVQTRITEAHLMFAGEPPKKAVQIVFMNDDVAEDLAREAKGNMMIQVSAPKATQAAST